MKKKITFCFDIDNTLCKTNGNKYNKSKPDSKAINLVNMLFDKGHYVKIYTARHMGRNNDNSTLAFKKGYKKTYNQLSKWGLKFHKLHISKPSADIYVDDKSYGYNVSWKKNLKKFIK